MRFDSFDAYALPGRGRLGIEPCGHSHAMGFLDWLRGRKSAEGSTSSSFTGMGGPTNGYDDHGHGDGEPGDGGDGGGDGGGGGNGGGGGDGGGGGNGGGGGDGGGGGG